MKRISADRILFKIDASRCTLQVGDHVTPDQVLGFDTASGEQVLAGCSGLVEAISFSGADHALLVLVKAEMPVSNASGQEGATWLRVDASSCAVRLGDLVTEETVIGKDVETGETVRAGMDGRVEAVSFSGADHALIVLLRP